MALHYRALMRCPEALGGVPHPLGDPLGRAYSYSIPARAAFAQLPVMSPYDSASRWGLCLKLSDTEAYSLSAGWLVAVLDPVWNCAPLRAKLRWRIAQ